MPSQTPRGRPPPNLRLLTPPMLAGTSIPVNVRVYPSRPPYLPFLYHSLHQPAGNPSSRSLSLCVSLSYCLPASRFLLPLLPPTPTPLPTAPPPTPPALQAPGSSMTGGRVTVGGEWGGGVGDWAVPRRRAPARADARRRRQLAGGNSPAARRRLRFGIYMESIGVPRSPRPWGRSESARAGGRAPPADRTTIGNSSAAGEPNAPRAPQGPRRVGPCEFREALAARRLPRRAPCEAGV